MQNQNNVLDLKSKTEGDKFVKVQTKNEIILYSGKRN